MDVPVGVTREEGHTGFILHLPSAVLALFFFARRIIIQPFLSLVDREVEFCVLNNDLIVLHLLGIFFFCEEKTQFVRRELYDQPKVALSLKTRMVKAEAIEALLHGCSTWTLRQEQYAKLRTVHHRVLLRIIGAQRKRTDDRMSSYSRAL